MKEIILFLINLKLFLFWLWLWQLKEYHLGRFLAHFETQKFKKLIASFYWFKIPEFTKKVIVIFIFTFLFLIWFVFYFNNIFSVILIIFAPIFSSLIVFLFQIPTIFFRKKIIKKAIQKRKKFKNLLVIGITGSYGKTSTKEILAKILIDKFGQKKVLKTKEHLNSEMGISRTILNELNSKHEIFVVEMGAYNKGGIKLLANIVRPKIGIITGVNEQHLSLFGSMENLISAEGGIELIESLPKDGIIFLNAKNKHCLDVFNKITKIEKKLYGQSAEFLGQENILGAIAVAKYLKINEFEINQSIEKIKNNFPGIKIKTGINKLIIIDASYSANPTGIIAHLDYLKNIQQKKSKIIIIMPSLIELGMASKNIHRKIGQKINQVCNLAIITTKDMFKEIKKEADQKAIMIENSTEIIKKIESFCQSGDIILLESRVPSELIKYLIIDN